MYLKNLEMKRVYLFLLLLSSLSVYSKVDFKGLNSPLGIIVKSEFQKDSTNKLLLKHINEIQKKYEVTIQVRFVDSLTQKIKENLLAQNSDWKENVLLLVDVNHGVVYQFLDRETATFMQSDLFLDIKDVNVYSGTLMFHKTQAEYLVNHGIKSNLEYKVHEALMYVDIEYELFGEQNNVLFSTLFIFVFIVINLIVMFVLRTYTKDFLRFFGYLSVIILDCLIYSDYTITIIFLVTILPVGFSILYVSTTYEKDEHKKDFKDFFKNKA